MATEPGLDPTVVGPSFGSFFSGVGGLDLGLERAGWRCAWQVEIDEWCRRVLAAHWPDLPRFGDVKELNFDDLQPVDLVCGGFPCQPVAQNGRRLGDQDDRWLWPWLAGAIRHLRPRLVLVENVADLVVRGIDEVLGDLAALGYDTEWESLPASAFGAPHRRERIFIVAHADCIGREAAPRVLVPDPQEHLGQAEAWRSVPCRGAGGRVRPMPDPGVFRVADGFPTELDGRRLRAVGNAVVPQVAEWIGRRLMEVA